MFDEIKAGIVLIKSGADLPEALQFDSESFLPGWRFVEDLDGCGLDRKVREAGWTFFYLANEITAIAFGSDRPAVARRALQRILKNLKSERFNSLEVTRVSSRSFLGLPYTRVTVHSRHIQESMFLLRVPVALPERGPAKRITRVKLSLGPVWGTGLALDEAISRERVSRES